MPLPIADYRDEILDLVYQNRVVIITAETGAGKSTQVPQYLLEAGFNVVVTQPRRLAARSLAARVAEERSEELGGVVGYRTAVDGKTSEDTRLLYCTDGLELVRELMGRTHQYDVLVLDEVHEWNLNMEVLLAWAKRRMRKGRPFKLVIMSATMDQQALSRYFGAAACISVPGRLFEVREWNAGRYLETDVAKLLEKGRNVLVFQPGKAEIEKTIGILEDKGVDAVILPLHGELTPEQQDACFKPYDLPKCVVATNVAQTSITIPDVDAVVDSGYERRIELVDGVEGLYTVPISLADREQRKGRAGRCKPGIYIDHCDTRERRPRYAVAEILRVRLDQAVLRLAEAGVNAEELEFFHQPRVSEIKAARRSLVALGCMEDNLTVTEIGHKVARLPVSAHVGRMIVEAERLGVVKPVIRIAAIMEAGFLGDRHNRDWRELCAGEEESDCLAQLMIYCAAGRMPSDEDREKAGVHVRHFQRALDIVDHIEKALSRFMRIEDQTGDRTAILKAVCAGMVDRVFVRKGYQYSNGSGYRRDLSRDSVVGDAEFVVAEPFDLDIKPDDGEGEGKTLHLLTMVTRIKPAWLCEVAPQLVRCEAGEKVRFDAAQDCVMSHGRFHYRGRTFQADVPVKDHPEAGQIFVNWLASRTCSSEPLEAALGAHAELQDVILRNRRFVHGRGLSREAVKELMAERCEGISCIKELQQPARLLLS